MTHLLLFFLFLTTPSSSHAESSPSDSINIVDTYSGKDEKNGINLKKILKHFKKDFTFVSARYRDDKNHIRLIYANKLGMEGLKDKNHHYKDGSIFYKISYPAWPDPKFEASLSPGAQPSVRQIMLRDNKKFKNHNGWGYAAFDTDGKTLSGSPQETQDTCYSCHQITHDRNDIFSFPMETIVPNKKTPASTFFHATKLDESKKVSADLFKFKLEKFNNLDPDVKVLINQKADEVNFLNGKIMEMEFSGFLFELHSFLINKTRENGLPSIAFKKFQNQSMVSYAYIDATSEECKKDERLIRFGTGKNSPMNVKSPYIILKRCFPQEGAK